MGLFGLSAVCLSGLRLLGAEAVDIQSMDLLKYFTTAVGVALFVVTIFEKDDKQQQ